MIIWNIICSRTFIYLFSYRNYKIRFNIYILNIIKKLYVNKL